MSKFKEYLLKAREDAEAFLIEDTDRDVKSKEDYIVDAEEGVIVAFRLNFHSKRNVALTKVISGKILENNKPEEIYLVETRNGLQYGVPYSSVIWVKTGGRWPKGIYDEMKQGAVAVNKEEDLEVNELGELEDLPPNDEIDNI